MKSSVIVSCVALLCASLVDSQQLRGGIEDRELWFGGANECEEVTTAQDFDLISYASKTWYVQQQSETFYLKKDRNYCVTADYTLLDRPTWPWGYTIEVNNRAFDVDGKEFGGKLGAKQDETSGDPAKLRVSPTWLPGDWGGPYWILAYNEEEGYALVSGGQPYIPSGDGGLCRTSTTRINNSGLWIFSREHKRNESLITTVQDIALGMGIDVSILNDVDQSDCGYEE